VGLVYEPLGGSRYHCGEGYEDLEYGCRVVRC
jgi:hypothetical protein